jgi:beta-N-acetylhexosaminidase
VCRIAFRKLQKTTHNARLRWSFLFALIFFSVFVAGCARLERQASGLSSKPNDGDGIDAGPLTGEDSDHITGGNAGHACEKERAGLISASLDFRRLAAQVIISGIDGKMQLTSDMRLLLEGCPAGGIVLFRYNLDTDKEGIQALTSEASALIGEDGIPPFVAVDHEGGSVNRFRPGIAALSPQLSYWKLAQSEGWEEAVSRVEKDSSRTGDEIFGMGINMNLAPVAEYLNSDNSAFLEDRSYGPDPLFCAEAAAAFICGMEKAGVLCVSKHFPGSAGHDPHLFSSSISLGGEDLDRLIAPFAALIRGGEGRALMLSHTLVSARDPGNIASLSEAVMQNWLRQELGFAGLIISDDFSMAAARGAAPEEAAVKSLAAGADLVLVWPPDLKKTHLAIQAALYEGRIPSRQLREAAARIIFEKIRMGLIDIAGSE